MLRWFRRRSRLNQIIWIALIAVLLLVCAGAIWVLEDLPALDQLEAGLALPSTRLYDRHGQMLYEILPAAQGRNRALDLSEIPLHCRNAAIATEDANYYRHPGIDPFGILRAFWINLRGGEILAEPARRGAQAAGALVEHLAAGGNDGLIVVFSHGAATIAEAMVRLKRC